jgi:alkylation response protein AidB-like acyl-CoA dehydrogenase
VITIERPQTDSTEIQALIGRAYDLRSAFARTGPEVDARGADPTENMRAIHEAGLNRLHIPVQYGGLSNGEFRFAFATWIETLLAVCAGENGTGMNWGVWSLVQRELFDPRAGLPESTLRQLAAEVLEDGVRFVASNAEAGRANFDFSVTAQRVPGGLVLSGTKHFNTDSGGDPDQTYANVGCWLVDDAGRKLPYHAIVRLSSAGVERHKDWDNIGQRSTMSGAITYHDVFVPDGWHYVRPGVEPATLAGVWALHCTTLLGPGLGALDAVKAYLHEVKRTISPGVSGPEADPLVTVRLGDWSSKLAAATALLRSVARSIEAYDGPLAECGPIVIEGMRTKVACAEAALAVTQEVFELTGARSTARKYAMDRFWRNARTFSVHDPTDLKKEWVGLYELTGQLPTAMQALLRV